MPKDPILYDLVLLLSAEADEDTRNTLVSDVEAMIAAVRRQVGQAGVGARARPPSRINHRERGRLPPAAVHGADLAARVAFAHAADRRLGPALPDHQGRPGHARAARDAPPVLAGAAGVTAAAAVDGEAA